ncbi:hypothetical protein CDV55_102618 [Aspergillus turcosus]|uniref:Mitochondrial division protein 1 n=1 Tax=Aspergillus turcosus TaxID=1245748 RepID=A0A229YMN0_9EURO|nr:hypothetical protein CDV55_102618 [Aspergillus turcosus]RLM00391.1 hypothetical protein CFD26_107825 [Aspergillus turcosus]
MGGVKNWLKPWRGRKPRSQESQDDGSNVVGVSPPAPLPTSTAEDQSSDLVDSPPPSDPSGKKAVALANPGNSQLTTTSPSEATLDETSNIPVHPHVSHASLVIDHAEADPGPEEHQLLTEQSTELSISQRLWNSAYDSLEQDKDTADLVQSYLKTLTAVLQAEKTSSVATSEDDELAAQVESPTTRQDYMKKLVAHGQKKIETSSKIKMAVGDVAQFILSAKGMIDLAIQNIPQAALPWAGVCIGLQILLNPAQATKSNLAGIAHVTARMDWYCALTEHLLNKNNIMTGTESFQEVMEQLEKAVVLLYKELLLYQMKSVCSYYRHRGVGFLRGLANLDDWDGDLARVKDAEIVVREYSEQYYREYQKSSLCQLVNSGFQMDKHLGNIHQDLREFIALQKTASRDNEDRECLQDLFAVDPQYDLKDLEERKDKLLDDAYDWVLRTDGYATFINWLDDGRTRPSCRVLWINGPAGTGKTMLFMGIIRELSSQPSALSPSLSYFFCQGTDQTRNSATIILRSLIWQLLVQQPRLISHLRDQRRNAGARLLRGERAFYVLSDALQSMLKDPCLSPVYFAIDALDECDRKTPGLDQLLQLIDTSLALSSKVKWLLSSRPEVLVHAGVKDLKNLHASRLPVNLDPGRLEGPVNAYIDHKLDSMKGKDGYDTDTLTNLSHEIRQRAMSTFLWVALAFKALDGVDGWDAVETIQTIPSGLSNVYDLIMTQIENGSPENQKRCKNILVAVVLAYRTLSLPELAVLAGLQPKINPRTIVEKCGSFLIMSGTNVSLIHQSAKEYLEANYTTKLGSGVGHGHADISARSINGMGSILKHNIYALPYSGFKSSDITPPDPDPLAPIRYSCVYWVGHLCKAKDQGFENELTDGGAILQFLKEYFLHWLEALSLISGISENIRLLKALQAAVEFANNTELSAFLRDMNRFILFFRQVIDFAPLQAYYSGLVFAPQRSLIRQTFEKFIPNWISIVPGQELDWSPCLYTLECTAISVAFSATGDRLASGLDYGTIKIWDTATGDCTQVIRDYDTEIVMSVTFLKQDQLASASSDRVKIWDTATGDCVQIFQGHNDSVSSLSFSATSEQLASGSFDKTIKIWDVTTSKCVQTLAVNHKVRSIAYSNTGEKLAAGLEDGWIMIWDTVTGKNIAELDSDSLSVESVAFSANDKRLASGCGYSIKIWDTATGQCMQTLECHSVRVSSVSFSTTSDQLASGSRDGAVKVWDTATGKCIQTLGREESITSVSFSATGDQVASAGWSGIKVWDVAIGNQTTPTPLQSDNDSIFSVAFSASGHRLASQSFGGTIMIWDTAKGTCMQNFKGPRYALPVAFSATCEKLASGELLCDNNFGIWDTATGECMKPNPQADYPVVSTAFSATGKQLAAGLSNGNIMIWNTVTGEYMRTLNGQNDFEITAVAFSATGERVAAGSSDGDIMVWNMSPGDCTMSSQARRGFRGRVTSVAFSASGNHLASASKDRTIMIWYTATADCIPTLRMFIDTTIRQLLFDPTSTYLLTEIGRIKVDLSSLIPAMTSDARDTTKEETLQSYLDQGNDAESEEESFEEEEPAEENSVSSNDDQSVGDFFEEEESAEEDSVASIDNQSEEESFEKEESADKESGEEDALATARLSYPVVTVYDVYGYGLSRDNTWIARDGQNILWIPAEFRPNRTGAYSACAVHGNMVAIGCY